MAAPIPRIMGYKPRPPRGVDLTAQPIRPPRNPNIGPSTVRPRSVLPSVDWGPPPPLPGWIPPGPCLRFIVRGNKLVQASYWRCDRCRATGTGCADDCFAHEEVEHCLTGCNGSLRAMPVYGPEPPPMLTGYALYVDQLQKKARAQEGLAPIPAKLVSG